MKTTTHDPFVYPIGERIKYFRKNKNISTNKLANMAGISQSYLRDIELSNKNPTVEILYLICNALGVSLKTFFDTDNFLNFSEDPLFQRIYQLSPDQRNALLIFLDKMLNITE